MTPLLGVLFIPYRTSIIHPTLWHWTRKHLLRGLTRAEAQRDRAGASIEGDQILPSRRARKLPLVRAFLRAQAWFCGATATTAEE